MATVVANTNRPRTSISSKAKLTFLGGAGTVTGSSYLLEIHDAKILVDCGLFQGSRKLKELNWTCFGFDTRELDAVLLTHAHIDHVGLLPRLVRQGYEGPIFATDATCALLKLVLPDSAHLQEQDALYAEKKGYSRHKPPLPLYTLSDAEATLKLIKPTKFGEPIWFPYLTATWHPAGHILGSAIIQIEGEKSSIVFSGDLGRFNSEMMKPPSLMSEATTLLVESTYGNRGHGSESMEDRLAEELDTVIQRESVMLVPAFAVGRTQQILFLIRKLQDAGRIPNLPIYIDSPMAADASHIYCRYGDDHNLDINLLMDDKVCPLRCPETHFVRDVEESKALNEIRGPAVIISASGMCSGGRILHHLKWRLPHKENSVIFVGYQAEGTRGRRLLEGADRIRIHGDEVTVKARITQVPALSAHADQPELLTWLSGFGSAPKQTFITHGEVNGSLGLKEQISSCLGWETQMPIRG
ncbi:MAG TPA: MBL fold metallo-hydrolase, partial [Anaerolineales bacterium]|nr:MBL fold metallo-hydrolase [Anaerolineales bacterium]